MVIYKYFQIAKYKNGEILSLIVQDFNEWNKYEKILFVRTPTTGSWMDTLFVDNTNVTRILYTVPKTARKKYEYHKSTMIVDFGNLENTLVDSTFDLIVIDPFHEYRHSMKNLNLFSSLLTEKGLLLCHDCFPDNEKMAHPTFVSGPWCGETYIALVDFAHHHPDFFYAVLKIDTGIGFISKIKFDFLENELNTDKQENLLKMHEDQSFVLVYHYFLMNSKDLINAILP